MARKVLEFVVSAEGRDKGKKFILTEMPARKAEGWAFKAALAIGKSNPELGEEANRIKEMGAAAFVGCAVKILLGMPSDVVLALLDDAMTSCVEIVTSANLKRKLVDDGGNGDDIEEIGTRFSIYKALFELHTGFSIPVGR